MIILSLARLGNACLTVEPSVKWSFMDAKAAFSQPNDFELSLSGIWVMATSCHGLFVCCAITRGYPFRPYAAVYTCLQNEAEKPVFKVQIIPFRRRDFVFQVHTRCVEYKLLNIGIHSAFGVLHLTRITIKLHKICCFVWIFHIHKILRKKHWQLVRIGVVIVVYQMNSNGIL